jgi:hypothetical protein
MIKDFQILCQIQFARANQEYERSHVKKNPKNDF